MNVPHFIELPVRDKRFGFPYWRRQVFFFNMAAWMAFYDEYGWDMEVVTKLHPGELTAKMAFYAAQQGNFKRGRPFRLSFAEFTMQLAKMTREDGAKLDAVFRESAVVMSDKMKTMGSGGSKKK